MPESQISSCCFGTHHVRGSSVLSFARLRVDLPAPTFGASTLLPSQRQNRANDGSSGGSDNFFSTSPGPFTAKPTIHFVRRRTRGLVFSARRLRDHDAQDGPPAVEVVREIALHGGFRAEMV